MENSVNSASSSFTFSALLQRLSGWRLRDSLRRRQNVDYGYSTLPRSSMMERRPLGRRPLHLLTLPREIRDQILGEVFFPGEKEPKNLTQNTFGTAQTATRTIWPYNTDPGRKANFDISILCVCRQLQGEGEQILYGTSTFNLMYQDWQDSYKFSYEFLQALPRRLRRLIQRVERKCYSEPYLKTITLFDWCVFMKFLADECPSLHTLKLWGPGDRGEGTLWVQTCKQDQQWVQAILQIKTLRRFDIPMITGGSINDYPEFKLGFLPQLRRELLSSQPDALQPYPRQSLLQKQVVRHARPFHFLHLPREIRDMVYKEFVLTSDRRIHPGLKSWYDGTTRDAFNAIMTCKAFYMEISPILYGESIFCAGIAKYNPSLVELFRKQLLQFQRNDIIGDKRPVRQVFPIKHVSLVFLQERREMGIVVLLVAKMPLQSLELTFSSERRVKMIDDWMTYGPQPEPLIEINDNAASSNTHESLLGEWRGGFVRTQLKAIAMIPKVTVTFQDSVGADHPSVAWLSNGLRQELLKGGSEHLGLDWLYVDLSQLCYELGVRKKRREQQLLS